MILQNRELTVTISALGAELKSIKDTNQVEYLWQADAAFWNKTSPILFPIVGSLKNNTYLYNQKEYHLSRHGFARDYEFTPEKISETEARFTLEANAETLEKYPFDFKLTITYRLIDTTVVCEYNVTNLGNGIMPFCIGAHPAFMLHDDMAHYKLHFNNDSLLNRLELTSKGLIGSKTETIPLNNHYLPLNFELFYKDALVFRNLKSTEIALINNQTKKKVLFKFEGFSHFGIWSAPNAPFICLEPWCGMADLENHNSILEEKEGVLRIAPNEQHMLKWSFGIY